MTFLAKSDGTTLTEHTSHVVAAMSVIARHLIRNISDSELQIALHAASLHDLGKASPHFQRKLVPGYDPFLDNYEIPHRHEISSILFLPLYPNSEWLQIIDMVIAHHKSLRAHGNKKGRGLLDLINDYGVDEVFERHSDGWATWSGPAIECITSIESTSGSVILTSARQAYDETLALCKSKERGRSQWRGLLMSADHLASALQEDTNLRVGRLFREPNLDAFAARAAVANGQLFPLSKMSAESGKPHTLLVSPTGSGKTDFLFRRCGEGRVFYMLPFQASINAMFVRLNDLLNKTDGINIPNDDLTDIRRIHAAAQIEICDGYAEETILQKHPGAAIKVMTPHQVASIVFGLSGHEATALDVCGQNVILDEVHVYNEQSQAMVFALIRSLLKLGCKVHIGSATIPIVLLNSLRELLGGASNVYEPKLSKAELQTYDRHVVHRLPNENAARRTVKEAVLAGKRVLFVSNRVALAQDRFEWVKEELVNVPRLLVHSRFRRGDRATIERKIEAFDKGAGPCVVCATQVVEVSLDISFDTIITDCAPIDSLVQRFGRVNRRRLDGVVLGFMPVYVIAPPQSSSEAKPYNLRSLESTWAQIPDGGVLRELDIQQIVDSVYPTLELTPIDVHLVDDGEQFKLKELCNYPKSLLLEALEIDSATLIRASDEAAYRRPNNADRQQLEIPVSFSTIRKKVGKWRQVDVGHHPFICPDDFYESDRGLLIGEGREPQCTIL